jgi:hypothetical protein
MKTKRKGPTGAGGSEGEVEGRVRMHFGEDDVMELYRDDARYRCQAK